MFKNYNFKNSKGISLTSLVVIVIVLLILAGTALYSGLDTFNESRKMAFLQELQIVQGQANIIYEKIKSGEIDYNSYLTDYVVTSTSEVIQEKSNSSYTDFRLIEGKDNLLKIGIDGINSSFYINFKTAEVIAKNGLNVDGKTYYTLKDFGYTQTVNTAAKISSSIENSNSIYKIKLSVDLPPNISDLQISYTYDNQLQTATSIENDIYVDNNTDVEVTYTVTDNNNNPIIISQTQKISYRNFTSKGEHNPPRLVSGMTPVIFDSDTSNWIETTENNLEWYNYNNNSFAHVKLNDGSIFVWVPRFTTSGTNYTFSEGIEDTITKGVFYDEKLGKELFGIWVAKYPSSETTPPYIQSIPGASSSDSIYNLKDKISNIVDYTAVYGLYPTEANTFQIDTTKGATLQTLLDTSLTNRIAISVF